MNLLYNLLTSYLQVEEVSNTDNLGNVQENGQGHNRYNVGTQYLETSSFQNSNLKLLLLTITFKGFQEKDFCCGGTDFFGWIIQSF